MNELVLFKIRKEVFLSEHVEKKRTRKLLIMTFLISMFIMVSIAAVMKVNIKRDHPSEELHTALSYDRSDHRNVNEVENNLLILLSNATGSGTYTGQKQDTYTIYIDTLYQYFSIPEINLSVSKYDRMEKEITDLYLVIQNEGTNDLNQMSIDGRIVVVYLLEQIYKNCDLTIQFNENNTIKSIYDQQKHILYGRMARSIPEGMNVSAGIIIVSVLIILTVICYLISSKKRLFVKEVIYDGYKKKRFA